MRRLLLCFLLTACSPGAFDDLVGPDFRDAGVPAVDAATIDARAPELDAGDASSPDASARDAELALDDCGQLRPARAQWGIDDGGVLFAGTILQNDEVTPRYPTSTLAVGSDTWWLFGGAFRLDTVLIQDTDSITRAAMARPYALDEAASGAPLPSSFVPTLEADRAMLNDNEQLVHNTGDLLRTGPSDALLFYAPAALSGSEQGLASRPLGTRLANVHFENGRAQATPVPALVFGPELPAFRHGVIANGYVYLYGCVPGFATYDCMVARAPQGQAALGTSYEFRTTAGWSSDFSAATYVLNDARDELSISFNAFLGSYLAVSLHGLTAQLDLRTSAQPEGPWEPLATIALPPPADPNLITYFGGIEHAALASQCGRRLALTYFVLKNPSRESELRRVEVLLREGTR